MAASYIAHTNVGTKVLLTTYGSPRVGDTGYKKWFYTLQNLSTQRYVFKNDPIPRSNPFGIHTGHLFQIVDENSPPKIYWNHDGCDYYDDEKKKDLCLRRFNYKGSGYYWYAIVANPGDHSMKKYVPYVKKKSNDVHKFELRMEKE